MNVVVDWEFVERLSPEERQDLVDLLKQQQRIDAQPGSELTMKELKDLIVEKAFRSTLREVQDLVFFFDDMSDIFRGIQKDAQRESLVRT